MAKSASPPLSPSSIVNRSVDPQEPSAAVTTNLSSFSPPFTDSSAIPLPSPALSEQSELLSEKRNSVLKAQDENEDGENLMESQMPKGLKEDGERERVESLDEAARYLQLIQDLNAADLKLSAIHSKVYELQEYRHSTKSSLMSPPKFSLASTLASPSSDVPLTPVEQLLIGLNHILEEASDLLPHLYAQLQSLEPPQSPQGATELVLGELESGVGPLEYAVIKNRYEEVETDWKEVVAEVEGAKQELKEDRWIDVFRASATQAEEMMLSLEKACAQCLDAIRQARQLQTRPSPPSHSIESWRDPEDQPPITTAVFESVLKSFEAKKRHYLPAVEKVLTILDKGVKERVTRNGETLRRYTEMRRRWDDLTERILRLDSDLTSAHLYLISRNSPHRQKTKSSAPLLPPQPHYQKFSTSTPSEGSTSSHSQQGSSDASSASRVKSSFATPPSSTHRNRRSSIVSNSNGNPNVFQRLLGTLKNGSRSVESSNIRITRENSLSPSQQQTSPIDSRSQHLTPKSEPVRRHHPYGTPGTVPFPSAASPDDERLSSIRVAKPAWNSSPKVPELPASGQNSTIDHKASSSALGSGDSSLGARPSSRTSTAVGGYATSEAGSDYGTPSRHLHPGSPSSRIPRARARSNNFPPESEAAESLDVPGNFLHSAQRSFTPTSRSPRLSSLPRSHSASKSLSLIPLPSSPTLSSHHRPAHSGMPLLSPSLPTLSSLIDNADDNDSPLFPPSQFRQRTYSRSQTPETTLRANVRNSTFYTPGQGTPLNCSVDCASTSPSNESPSVSRLRVPRASMSLSPVTSGKSVRPSSVIGPPSSFRGASPSPASRSVSGPASSSSQQQPPRPPSRSKTPTTASSSPGVARPSSRGSSHPITTPSRPSSRATTTINGHVTSSRPPSRTQTPSRPHQPHSVPFPHPHNQLDLALSRLLKSSPFPSHQNLQVERLTPLPKGSAASTAGHQTGSFIFGSAGSSTKVKTMQCRLLELNGGRSAGEEGKIKKVMVRVGGGWLDLEVQLTKLGF